MSANSRLTVAIHSLCWIEFARRQGEPPQTSSIIAGSLATNPVVVRRILSLLREAGLVWSGHGPGAGWSLARPSDRVTMLDVYRALEEEGPFALHRNEPNPSCVVGRGIRPALRSVYRDIESLIAQELGRHTIAEVLAASIEAAAAAGDPRGIRLLELGALS